MKVVEPLKLKETSVRFKKTFLINHFIIFSGCERNFYETARNFCQVTLMETLVKLRETFLIHYLPIFVFAITFEGEKNFCEVEKNF